MDDKRRGGFPKFYPYRLTRKSRWDREGKGKGGGGGGGFDGFGETRGCSLTVAGFIFSGSTSAGRRVGGGGGSREGQKCNGHC